MEILNKIIPIDKYNNIGLLGMTDEFFCAYVNKLFYDTNSGILILTPSLYEANKLYASIIKYNNKVLLFPMDDFLTSESIAISPELKSTRLDTLDSLINNPKQIVVAHLNSYLRFLPNKDTFKSRKLLIEKGKSYNRDVLIKNLIDLGYKRETIVTNTGEFGVRGFVLDIFPINSEKPVRIEFLSYECPVYRRAAGSRPDNPYGGRAAVIQLHAASGGIRRACVHGRDISRAYGRKICGLHKGIPPAHQKVRRGDGINHQKGEAA